MVVSWLCSDACFSGIWSGFDFSYTYERFCYTFAAFAFAEPAVPYIGLGWRTLGGGGRDGAQLPDAEGVGFYAK